MAASCAITLHPSFLLLAFEVKVFWGGFADRSSGFVVAACENPKKYNLLYSVYNLMYFVLFSYDFNVCCVCLLSNLTLMVAMCAG